MFSNLQNTGYRHPSYAISLAEYGTPHELTYSGGWVIKREIPGFPYRDAMGCYPIFSCTDWSQLGKDFECLGSELVSVSLVSDPFGNFDLQLLHKQFRDIVIPFKDHYIVDLGYPLRDFVSGHHDRYSQKALSVLNIEKCDQPIRLLDEWVSLYANLIKRHCIRGIPAFSTQAFSHQLNTPGLVAFRAKFQGETLGILLWFVQNEFGYYHLGAFSDQGYKMRASFALFRFAIEYFAESGLKFLNLGAGAGIKNKPEDGLSRFKNGWSNGIRTAYFCGRIFDPHKYQKIIQEEGIVMDDYFPAYRKGEFL